MPSHKKEFCLRGHKLDAENRDSLGKCIKCKSIRAQGREQTVRDRARRRTPESRYYVLHTNAKVRNLDVTITLEKYKNLISSHCFYCGGVLPETGSGIDRIDSKVGYVEGNCRPCCGQCNRAKTDMTESEFKEWVLRIYNSWVSK